jgi:polyhydroxyalkanoate synthase
MADKREPQNEMPDPAELSRTLASIAEQSQKVVTEFLARNAEKGQPSSPDPYGIGRAFLEMTNRMMAQPDKVLQAQTELWNQYARLWHNAARRMLGEDPEPLAKPQKGDNRFRDPAWEENFLFDYVKQSYLLTSRWLQDQVHDVKGLDDHTAEKVDFYTRQFADALAPSNFVLTNPKVLRETVESGGQNLVRGLQNLLRDLEAGKGELRISQTDTSAFTVGENIAVTPGKVVY